MPPKRHFAAFRRTPLHRAYPQHGRTIQGNGDGSLSQQVCLVQHRQPTLPKNASALLEAVRIDRQGSRVIRVDQKGIGVVNVDLAVEQRRPALKQTPPAVRQRDNQSLEFGYIAFRQLGQATFGHNYIIGAN